MVCRELFAHPPAKYRPMPFWFWNTKLRQEELLAQARAMHRQGCGGFFIHARFGLETEYLGDEWFDLIGAVCELARELGMEVWLYDEESFPSGLVGGRVTAHRAYRSKFVDLTEKRVCGPGAVRMALPAAEAHTAWAAPASAVLAGKQHSGVREDGYAGEADSPSNMRSEWIELSRAICGRELFWEAPDGEWLVMVFSRCTLDSEHIVFGVDYTDEEAMSAFFQQTLDAYAARLGPYFGDPIKGIFTDEPTLLPWHHDASWYQDRPHRRVTFWTPTVEGRLREAGYEPEAVLAALFYDLGPLSRELRRAYWELALELYERTFFVPYREWCDHHGLQLTGHLLLEEGLYNNALFQADPTRALRHFHRPGTDHLGAATEGPYGGGHLHTVTTNMQGEKLVSSVAHLMGRRRVLTESFGCGGWDMTLEQMKRIVDWQWALGMNFLCPHAVFASIEGFRKTDAPPCALHNTLWAHYRTLADYVARLSYLLSQGEPVGRIALVYPLQAFQEAYAIGEEGGRARLISDTFDYLCGALWRHHYDFEIVPRWALEAAGVERGKLRTGSMTFDAVLWPFPDPADELHRSLAEWVPVHDVDERIGESLQAVIESLGRGACGALPPALDVRVNGKVYGAIKAVHRRLEHSDLYYLANMGDEEVDAEIRLPGEGPWELWDCETGEVFKAEATVLQGDSLLKLRFEGGRTWVVTSGTGQATVALPRPAAHTHVLELPDTWNFRLLGPNMLPLDELRMTHVARGGGQEWRYRANFTARHVPADLALVFDDIEYRHAAMRSLDLEVRVNGCSWRPPQFQAFRWPEFKLLPIADAVRAGENTVEVVIRHQAWQDEPKVLTVPPKLVGSFGLDAHTLVPPPSQAPIGSWTDLGLSYYSGSAEYSCVFSLEEGLACEDAVVELDEVGCVVEVYVNGEHAGTRCWRPWRVHVGRLLHRDENRLTLRITNTMANFLEARAVPSGLLGKVRVRY